MSNVIFEINLSALVYHKLLNIAIRVPGKQTTFGLQEV